MFEQRFAGMPLSSDLKDLLSTCKSFTLPANREELLSLAMGENDHRDTWEVTYEIEGQGPVLEATVTRCRNGVSVNYEEAYMRRRDPNCMVVADDGPTDKTTYQERFGKDFGDLKQETLAWLKTQELIVLPVYTGGPQLGYPTVMVCPRNAGFFAAAMADLQGMIEPQDVAPDFTPAAVMYVAPPFRHTHFDGKQVVVHNRDNDIHQIFAYNLYPGPSAKKGAYGVLIHQGEQEGWITAHASTVQVVTPYDNILSILHEGASGGGKSEMLEPIHRETDGSLLVGHNLVTKERRTVSLPRTCELRPVSDDMALCHTKIQDPENKKLVVMDAEAAWFLRFNHIDHYGTDPYWESLCCHPKEKLIFLNMDAKPSATALIWEHIHDSEGVPCPNPRVVMPRNLVPHVVNDPTAIDIRSFGIRTPPCTRENPSYGILGILHVLPPSLAWLWRLVAPRGHANPSIVDTGEMQSEGVGSFWPFATGRRVTQANLLLQQITETTRTRYILVPNQHVGAWETGFMPQWLSREYLARRGNARFRREQLVPSKCPLIGYAMSSMQVEGTVIAHWFLETHTQPEIGEDGFQAGAEILTAFFKKELPKFLEMDLDDLGKEIIKCCMDDGTLEQYEDLIPQDIFVESAPPLSI